MLTAATILMSLDTDAVNVRHVSSARADTTVMSFAKSFDESSALAGEMTQPTDVKGQKSTADVESSFSGKEQDVAATLPGIKMKGNGRAGDEIQNKSDGIQSKLPTMSAKEGASISSGVKRTTADKFIPHSGVLKEDASSPVEAGILDDQLSAGDVKEVDQRSGTETIGDAKTDAAAGVVALPTDVVASAASPIPSNSEKLVIQNEKERLVPEKNQETVPTKAVAKGRDGFKAEKSEKTEEKTEKTVGTVGSTAGIETQAIFIVPVMAPPSDGRAPILSASPGDDAPLRGLSAAMGRRVGMAMITDSKAGNQSVSTGRIDGGNIKAGGSALVDDPASRKTEIDGTKAAPSAAKAIDDDNAKTPSPAVAATGLPHAEQGMPGTAIGGASGGMAVHVITTIPQTTEISSSMPIAQAGSGTTIDLAGPIDVAHKTLIATPTTLEVGVANGTHGWLKIRAEMTGGGMVNASLSTASSSGQEMLHKELPSLAAYLQSERVAVNTVIVQPAMGTGADSRGLAGGMNGEGRGQAQSSGQGGESRQNTSNTVLDRPGKDMAYNDRSGAGVDELLSSVSYAGGSWLSVRA